MHHDKRRVTEEKNVLILPRSSTDCDLYWKMKHLTEVELKQLRGSDHGPQKNASGCLTDLDILGSKL